MEEAKKLISISKEKVKKLPSGTTVKVLFEVHDAVPQDLFKICALFDITYKQIKEELFPSKPVDE